MMEIEKPVVEVQADGTFGRFTIEPLERGYGITLGNSLRRILLSSLVGAAVTHIKIEGVLHEFSTIPGVAEDTTEIVLNLKRLNLKLSTDKAKILRLEAKGEKEVTAADITADAEVEILNPELHIATLSDRNSRLVMEIRVERGKGYVPADRHLLAEQAIGLIPVDSIFTPITKVNYRVEDTRVGQVTNYDRLILEVWTDGSVAPHEAVVEAAQIMQNYLSNFTEIRVSGAEEEAGAGEITESILDAQIDILSLSVRSLNCLKRAGVRSVGDMVSMTRSDVMKMKNFGQKSLDEVVERLAAYGLNLHPEETPEAE